MQNSLILFYGTESLGFYEKHVIVIVIVDLENLSHNPKSLILLCIKSVIDKCFQGNAVFRYHPNWFSLSKTVPDPVHAYIDRCS